MLVEGESVHEAVISLKPTLGLRITTYVDGGQTSLKVGIDVYSEDKSRRQKISFKIRKPDIHTYALRHDHG